MAPDSSCIPKVSVQRVTNVSDLNKYELLCKIGHGTYGEVFKARNRKTQELVATKRIIDESKTEGLPITAAREISVLKNVNHENIVKLIEVCTSKKRNSLCPAFHLVFEFCEHDLAGLLSNMRVSFMLEEIKNILQQLFKGIFYLHANHIIHRDLKSSNILLNKKGVLKVADLGLARPISSTSKENSYTNRVVTLWYRPPELLLGERNYGGEIDMWSAGCIMAEFWTRCPILQGSSEINQLKTIITLCGSITIDNWPTVVAFPSFQKMDLPQNRKNKVKERLSHHVKHAAALDIISRLLVLDPEKRMSADDVLYDDFFYTDPIPCGLSKVLSTINESMFEYSAKINKQNQLKNGALQKPNNDTTEKTLVKDRIY